MVSGGSIRRDRLVKELAAQGIRERRVLDAMRVVPRESFVEEALQGKAYSDRALPIGEKQTISQPWIVARMCELAGAGTGRGRVLEIGTGSGLSRGGSLAALRAGLHRGEAWPRSVPAALGQTRSRSWISRTMHLKIFDGSYGWSEFAPVSRHRGHGGGRPDVPELTLVEQLEEGGRFVAPICRASPGAQGRTDR